MQSIVQWLEGLGLGRYADAFVEANIEPRLLPELSESDFEKLGVTLGHRKQLARAIAGLTAPAAPLAGAPVVGPRGVAEAERRQLTVMFWDLVGSTALSARLDPEDLRVVIGAYHRACTEVIARAGGFVAQFMGDGALAYFGYPQAHEDDAERAVLAGLELVRAVGEVDVRTPLQARVGIATGLVVVGDLFGEGAAQRRAVVGETPNLAARLQALAEPGTVVIAAGTRRLLGRLFDYRALDPAQLKGFAEPVPAWQVLHASAEESRFEARQERGVLPLVGREEELELLMRRWRRAKAGESQVVLLSGEAGIGKSRIVRALQDRLAADPEPHAQLRCFCSPHHQDSALYPIIVRLEHEAGFARDDAPEVRRGKLEALLAAAAAPEEEVALLASLLSLPAAERDQLAGMSPERRKEKTLAALLARVERLAARAPVLIVFEDLHWVDPTSLELLKLQIERWRTLAVLMVVTARPEFAPPWLASARVTTIALARLDAGQVGALVERVADGRKLPPEVLRQIIERTDGTPLFAEELTKTVLESGLLRPQNGHYVLDGPLPPRAIPTTLHDSLMARLDRLAWARDVAQIGAALGREFSYELLRAVVALPDERLQSALRDLVHSGLIFARGAQPAATYTFKHALVQDAAYQSMLTSRRVQLHARIVDVLEPTFPELVDAEPETLARHLTVAALPRRAIPYWLAAGRRAMQRGAHQEAIGHLQAGIALLDGVADKAERVRFEIDLQAALGFALTATRGYAAPDVEAAFSRAYALCQASGEPAQAIPVLRGFATFHWVSGNLATARRFGLQLAESAERTGDAEASSVAHGMLAGILHHMGEIAGSELHCAKLAAPYDLRHRRNIVVRFGEDTPSVTWAYHGYNEAWRGNFAVALAAVEQAVAYASRSGHPFSIAGAQCRAAICSVIMRDPARAAAFAEPGFATARDLGFPVSRAIANVVLGWTEALDGRAREGVERISEGMTLWRSTGAAVALPCFFGLLAEAHLAAGSTADAIAAAEEGMRWGTEKAERAWEGLLGCVHGDALVAAGEPARAEASYQRALAWSRARDAAWGEFNAGLRLARLWGAAGRVAAARDLLTPLCARLPEAAESAVLSDARALLDALAPTPDRPEL